MLQNKSQKTSLSTSRSLYLDHFYELVSLTHSRLPKTPSGSKSLDKTALANRKIPFLQIAICFACCAAVIFVLAFYISNHPTSLIAKMIIFAQNLLAGKVM